MAQSCRALVLFVLAVVVASGSMTVKWNTQPTPAPDRRAVQNARVTAVQGTHVVLRLADGTIRTYTATPQQARLLQGLIGTVITFHVR